MDSDSDSDSKSNLVPVVAQSDINNFVFKEYYSRRNEGFIFLNFDLNNQEQSYQDAEQFLHHLNQLTNTAHELIVEKPVPEKKYLVRLGFESKLMIVISKK